MGTVVESVQSLTFKLSACMRLIQSLEDQWYHCMEPGLSWAPGVAQKK